MVNQRYTTTDGGWNKQTARRAYALVSLGNLAVRPKLDSNAPRIDAFKRVLLRKLVHLDRDRSPFLGRNSILCRRSRTWTGREAFHSFAVTCGPELSHSAIFQDRDPFKRTLEMKAEGGGREREREKLQERIGDVCMPGFKRMT